MSMSKTMSKRCLRYPRNSFLGSVSFGPQLSSSRKTIILEDLQKKKLQKGAYNGPLYGLDLAELAGFPEAVITDAKMVAQQLRAEADKKKSAEDIYSAMQRRAYVRCFLRLKQAVEMAKHVPQEQLEIFVQDVKAQLKRHLCEMESVREAKAGEDGEVEE